MTALDVGLGPGLYYDLPHPDYLADPVPGGSLSRSGAKLILPPNCPAKYRWAQDHPQEPKDVFDFGNAAHGLVLGDGPEIDVLDFPDWRTKAAQTARKESRAAGRVPLLTEDWQRIEDMAAAIKNHPTALKLLDPWSGTPEASLIWRHAESGVMLRCRPDFLPHTTRGRMIIPDYKTCESADRDEFMTAAARYGYHLQAAWLIDGVKAVGAASDAAVVFVAQEKEPPYLVNVIEPDERAVRIGRSQMAEAIAIFQHCQQTGRWPGYADDVVLGELPTWYLRRYDED